MCPSNANLPLDRAIIVPEVFNPIRQQPEQIDQECPRSPVGMLGGSHWFYRPVGYIYRQGEGEKARDEVSHVFSYELDRDIVNGDVFADGVHQTLTWEQLIYVLFDGGLG